MDVKRARSPRAPADGEEDKRRAGWRSGGLRPEMVLVGFIITLPVLVFVFGGRWGSFPSSSTTTTTTATTTSSGPHVAARRVVPGAGAGETSQKTAPPKNISAPATSLPQDKPTKPLLPQDKLLGGLLSAAFEESSCQSRYRSSLYRKPSPFPLSPYLVKKLRKYEAYRVRRIGVRPPLLSPRYSYSSSGGGAIFVFPRIWPVPRRRRPFRRRWGGGLAGGLGGGVHS